MPPGPALGLPALLAQVQRQLQAAAGHALAWRMVGHAAGHAGLALSIGVAAMINAAWLLVGLLRNGAYRPAAGWWSFLLRVVMACVALAGALWWCNARTDWLALQSTPWVRALWLGAVVALSATAYLLLLRVLGLRWWTFMRRAP